VLLYLDWDGFGALIKAAGGELRWGDKRELGRARAMHPRLRPPLVRGQLPLVHVGRAQAMVMDPNFVEMFFDGVRPRTMAERIVEHAETAASEA
jgi:hypothetical protein